MGKHGRQRARSVSLTTRTKVLSPELQKVLDEWDKFEEELAQKRRQEERDRKKAEKAAATATTAKPPELPLPPTQQSIDRIKKESGTRMKRAMSVSDATEMAALKRAQRKKQKERTSEKLREIRHEMQMQAEQQSEEPKEQQQPEKQVQQEPQEQQQQEQNGDASGGGGRLRAWKIRAQSIQAKSREDYVEFYRKHATRTEALATPTPMSASPSVTTSNTSANMVEYYLCLAGRRK